MQCNFSKNLLLVITINDMVHVHYILKTNYKYHHYHFS